MTASVAAATAFGTGASAGIATATVTTPAGATARDILVIYAARGTATTTWSAPNFTAVTAATGANGSGQILYRVLDGSGNDPGASFVITCSAAAIYAGVCVRVVNGNGNFDPAPTSGQVNASSVNLTAPGITTVTAGDLLLWFGGIDAGAGGVPETITLPAGYADSGAGQSSTSNGAGTNVGVAGGSIVQAVAGATGNVTGTVTPTGHVNMAALVGLVTASVPPLTFTPSSAPTSTLSPAGTPTATLTSSDQRTGGPG